MESVHSVNNCLLRHSSPHSLTQLHDELFVDSGGESI